MIKKYGMYVLVILLVLTASVMIYLKLNPKELPANLISATGKIDGNLITLNTKYPGRIANIAVEDGQKIQQNEVVAILTSEEYEKKLDVVTQSINGAKNSLKAMQEELLLMQGTIPLSIEKAKKAIEVSKAHEAQLKNSIESLKAVVLQSRRDYERVEKLYEKELIAKQKMEYSKLNLTTDSDKLQALQKELLAAKEAVAIAGDNFKIAKIQKKKIAAFQANIAAAKNKILALKANRAQLQVVIDELSIKSPISGFVVEKIANKGEVLAAGGIVATLIDPKDLYLKVFVDTITNGKVKIGDEAVIFLDAYPNKAIKAKVVSIAANAEFTPKEVAVKSDRIQRVYAVHLKPLEVEPLLKLGIPAVGVISINGKGLPSSLNDIPSI
jgi:HlyD family secretion protein